jgi:predicted nucleic acid-binding protein
VKVVSDAGPLMALAKVGRLDVLLQLFPKVWTPAAVYEELVTAGLRLGAPDAPLLESYYRSAQIEVRSPGPLTSEEAGLLGAGEAQSIRLAIEERADWLLVDDFDARQTASIRLQAAGLPTRVIGTLGVIVTAYQKREITRQTALEVVDALSARPDIWISAGLCRRVRETLHGEPNEPTPT